MDGNLEGAIQFTSDKKNGGQGRKVELFPLSEDPFANPNTQYRAQIYEKEVKENGVWKLRWKAEVFRGSTSIGSCRWYEEDEIRDEDTNEVMVIPNLSGSRILIGAAPGTNGTVKVEQVATVAWRY